MRKIFICLICIFSTLNASEFLCSEDSIVKDYFNGLRENFEGATVYPDSTACGLSCRDTYTCEQDANLANEQLSVFVSLDEVYAKRTEDALNGKVFTNLNLIEDGVDIWNIVFASAVAGETLSFPYLYETDKNVWLNKSGEKTSVPSIDGTLDIVFNVAPKNTSTITNNNTNVVTASFDSTKKWEFVFTKNDGTVVNMSSSVLNGYLLYVKHNENYYYCPPKRYSNIGGDLMGGRGFSSQATCEASCITQNQCIEKPDENCQITAEEVSHPVSDYTGKTVFTRKNYTITCSSEKEEIIGCNQYEITTNNGDVPYVVTAVGTESRDFTNQFDQAIALANMLEQMQHIWSGWHGECEYGTKFDSSFLSDPMTWLSYGMMVYSGALEATKPYGETMHSAAKTTEKAFDTVAETFSNTLGTASSSSSEAAIEGMTASEISACYGETVSSTTNAASTAKEAISITDKITELNTITEFKDVGGGVIENWDITVKYSDIAQLAMAAAAPEQEDFKKADDFLKAMLGDSEADEMALAYRNCMASIGLSFPNMISRSISVGEGSSYSLNSPLDNPLRVTTQQLAAIEQATSRSFLEEMYAIIDIQPRTGYDMYTILPFTSVAMTQAGQAICAGGAISQAMNISNSSSSDSGGINGSALTNAGIKMALSYLPPPYNLIATMIFQIVTAFESGDACNDEEIASQWGMLQYKTNKFVNFDQCHHIETSCAAEWFWGSCMRHKNDYCCYDQITTRIFVEGLKDQLGKDWESCNDLTINDLKDISFRPCKDTESAGANKCFPQDKYDELIESLLKAAQKNGVSTGSIVNQAINSMAIPK